MEWLAGLQAGEQPSLFGMAGLVAVIVDLRQVIMDNLCNLGREFDRVTTESQTALVVGDDHGVAGETDDPGEWLPEQ